MCWIVYVPMTDIGQNLMRAVREEGDKTRALNRELFRECMEVLEEEGRRTRAMIKGISEQIKWISEQIKERNARIDKRLDQMTVTVESTSDEIKATSDDNREFFKQMLEAQNRILERDA